MSIYLHNDNIYKIDCYFNLLPGETDTVRYYSSLKLLLSKHFIITSFHSMFKSFIITML